MKTQKLLMMLTFVGVGLIALGVGVNSAEATIIGPYTADANTLHLYHFDEDSGAVVDSGNGTTRNLTVGAQATQGVSAFAGFGKALDTDVANDAAHARSDTATAISEWTGAGGAFTWEALIKTGAITGESQQIITRQDSTPGFSQFRIVTEGELSLVIRNSANNGNVGGNAVIPTTGDHAFVADEWFHAAVSYDGNESGTDNLEFYWTRVQDSVVTANLIGTLTLSQDIVSASHKTYFANRVNGGNDENLQGVIDEVRISSIVRGPGDFIFFIPEPSTLVLLAVGGLMLLGRAGWRRRR